MKKKTNNIKHVFKFNACLFEFLYLARKRHLMIFHKIRIRAILKSDDLMRDHH